MKKKLDYNDPKLYEPLDKEEAEIMGELERGEWISTPEKDFQRIKLEMQTAAKNTLKKTEKATIRLFSADTQGSKLLAAKEGIGYQTLISSILHKTVTGQIEL